MLWHNDPVHEYNESTGTLQTEFQRGANLVVKPTSRNTAMLRQLKPLVYFKTSGQGPGRELQRLYGPVGYLSLQLLEKQKDSRGLP